METDRDHEASSCVALDLAGIQCVRRILGRVRQDYFRPRSGVGSVRDIHCPLRACWRQWQVVGLVTANVDIAIATVRDACDRFDHRGTDEHDPSREPLPERIVIDELDRLRAVELAARVVVEWRTAQPGGLGWGCEMELAHSLGMLDA